MSSSSWTQSIIACMVTPFFAFCKQIPHFGSLGTSILWFPDPWILITRDTSSHNCQWLKIYTAFWGIAPYPLFVKREIVWGMCVYRCLSDVNLFCLWSVSWRSKIGRWGTKSSGEETCGWTHMCRHKGVISHANAYWRGSTTEEAWKNQVD